MSKPRGLTVGQMEHLEDWMRQTLGLVPDIWLQDRMEIGPRVARVRFIHRDGMREGRVTVRVLLSGVPGLYD